VAYVDVAAADAVREGLPTVVQAAARELVLVRWKGEVYALRTICPHHTQSFARGSVRARLGGTETPGEVILDDENGVLICPQHYWKFDIRSGVCVSNGRERVRTYPVVVEDGRVLVDVEGRTVERDASMRPV
jgi:nitrite reductase (NADH) small subunit